MAHIPYGYRIERGKAVIVPEEAERIRTFLNAYLDGFSIKNAGAEAEIPLSKSALRKLLGNEVYLGTDLRESSSSPAMSLLAWSPATIMKGVTVTSL